MTLTVRVRQLLLFRRISNPLDQNYRVYAPIMAHKLFTTVRGWDRTAARPGRRRGKFAPAWQSNCSRLSWCRTHQEESRPLRKSFEAEPDSPAGASSQPCLNREQCRAVLITRLLSLMSGKSGIRLQLVEYLKDLLNKDIIPALSCQ